MLRKDTLRAHCAPETSESVSCKKCGSTNCRIEEAPVSITTIGKKTIKEPPGRKRITCFGCGNVVHV